MIPEQKRGPWFQVLDVLFNVVVIVAIVAGIRTFLVSPFQVEGSSMVDTLQDREYIIINKLAYIIGQPHRGDVVVFRPPSDPSKFYVKRVIGEPGDDIMIRDGDVFVRQKGQSAFMQLDESGYLNGHNKGFTFRAPPISGDRNPITYAVPADSYFVLGDNRQGSLDSRSFEVDGKPQPYVARQEIKGRVWFVALPVMKIHALEAPKYAS